MKYSRRRLVNVTLSIILTLTILVILQVYGTPQYRMQVWSGWILFGLIAFLLSYNLRKKITMLPLGKAALWLQCHIYLGVVTSIIFLQHINYRLPHGKFEWFLALVFLITASSGVIGIILSRIIPKYLTRRGEEVIFERIPLLISNLKHESQALIIKSAEHSKSKVLFDYYHQHVFEYFSEPKNSIFHLVGSNAHWHKMVNKHRTLCRFITNDESEYASRLLVMMRQKNDLDYHYTLQGLLKVWTFLHLPFSYILIILTLLHLVAVYAFIGNF